MDSALDNFLNQKKEEKQIETPIEEVKETPSQEEVTTEVNTEVETTNSEVEPKKEESSLEEEGSATQNPTKEEEYIPSWAENSEEEEAIKPEEKDPISMFKEQGYTVDSMDDVAKMIREKELRIKELERLALYPNEEKKVEEVKKEEPLDKVQGLSQQDLQDYAILKSADYSSIPAEELYQNDLKRFFINPDGSFNQEGFSDYLDSKTSEEKRIEGEKVRHYLDLERNDRLRQLENKALEHKRNKTLEKENRERQLKERLNEVKEIKGLTLTQEDRKEIFKALSSGESQIYRKPDGSIDYKRSIETPFIYKKLDTIVSTEAARARAAANQSIFDEASNVNLNPTGAKGKIADPTPAPSKDHVTSILDNIRNSRR